MTKLSSGEPIAFPASCSTCTRRIIAERARTSFWRATAQKIVDWRTTHGPFRSVDALDDVPGIGPARIEQLRDLVTP